MYCSARQHNSFRRPRRPLSTIISGSDSEAAAAASVVTSGSGRAGQTVWQQAAPAAPGPGPGYRSHGTVALPASPEARLTRRLV